MNKKAQIILTLSASIFFTNAMAATALKVAAPPTISSTVLSGNVETIKYSNGTVVTNKSTGYVMSWAADHLTQITTYKFADGKSNSVSTVYSASVTKTFSGMTEYIKTNYPDGTSRSTIAFATNALSPKISFASDHVTKLTTYTFQDGTSNVMSEVLKATVTTSYGTDHLTQTTVYKYPDGTGKTEISNVGPTKIVTGPTGTTINTSSVKTQTKYVDGYTTTQEVLNLKGTSVSAAYTATAIKSVTSVAQGLNYQETYDYAPFKAEVKTITVKAADGAVTSFSSNNGDTFLDVKNIVTVVLDKSKTIQAVTVNNDSLGWSYQSFGVWNNAATSVISAGSAGSNITSGSSIPLTGKATYKGVAGGVYRDASNVNYVVAADMSANVNFASRNVNFATTNSIMTSDLNTVKTNSDLNLSGTLNYAKGVNSFSGSVSTNTMTGSAGGQFYGPAANEIGGVFAVKSSNAGYIGGFGAKR